MRELLTAQRKAARGAMELRGERSLAAHDPICPLDLADDLGIIVRLIDLLSMEGMYLPKPRPTILLSALRPAPRRRFTCAHELGHHRFGHSYRVDRALCTAERAPLAEARIEEAIADRFAAELLMPTLGLRRALSTRGIDPQDCDATELYRVSCYFGVGYSTLAHHLCHTLRAIGRPRLDYLLKSTPKKIHERILGERVSGSGSLVVVDSHWRGRPVDLEVGDRVVLPEGTLLEGQAISMTTPSRSMREVAVAVRPGMARVENPTTGWSVFVRVSRQEFVGLGRFRHLEEVDDE